MDKGYGNSEVSVAQYVTNLYQPEDEALRHARVLAAEEKLPAIQIGALDGQHLFFLTKMAQATKAVEIGTLGGYSGTFIARALPENGILHSFEIDPHHATIAERVFKSAGVHQRTKIWVGPATENLSQIEKEGPYDLVFVDADKINYPNYFRWAETHLRTGGLLIADNTFAWNLIGEGVAVPDDEKASVESLRVFNRMVCESRSFSSTIFPTEQGLTCAVKI